MAKKTASGGERIKARGESLIWVTVDAPDKQKIRTAAAFLGIPMSQFLKQTGLKEAEKILKKISS